MARASRLWITAAVGLVFVLAGSGCGGNANEADVAGTKGVALPDAPKSQAEFFTQQNELLKKPGAAGKSAKP